MTELVRLHAFAAELAVRPVGDAERAAAWACLLDSVGCALAGAAEPVVDRAARLATIDAAPGDSGLLGRPEQLRLESALLVNGAAIRALDFNDTYSGRNNHHPSESVIPLALAVAEREGWPGSRLVDAVAVGYRLSLSLGECWSGLLGRGWAPAATLGQIASTAFAAHLLGVDDATTVQAMALAALTAPTLAVVFRGELSDAKSMVSGLAAQSAWRAVAMARAGLTGPRDVLEGSGGFDEQVGGPIEIGADVVDARSIWHKAHPTVFFVHAAIDAGIEVSAALGGGLADVLADEKTTVEVRVPPHVAKSGASPSRWAPADRESAQFSLPVCTAVALRTGTCGLPELTAAVHGADATATADLLQRMTVVPDDRWSGYSGAVVTVQRGGEVVAERTVDHAKGSPANPFTGAELRDKYRRLVSGAYTAAFAGETLAALEGVLDHHDVRPMLRLLGGSSRADGGGGGERRA
jgi:2-methylcitrate dehydratase